ncbi:MAG: HAD-IA family hydrolase [Nitrospirota bacterium]|nr:HAD-IA family hydrolase [Nitrospirota bacterium]
MPIRLLLYDLDGTLVDSKDDLANAVNRTLSDLGLPQHSRQELYGFVGNGVRTLLARAVGEERPEDLENALAVFRAHYLNHLTDHTRLYPGVEQVLEAFGSRHQAIVTNKPMLYTEGVVRNLGLGERVGLVLGGDSIPALKPDPAMLRAALEHFGVAPEEALMVGDGLPDIGAARAAGVRCAILTCGLGQPQELLAARPDFVLGHMQELIPLVHRLDNGGGLRPEPPDRD